MTRLSLPGGVGASGSGMARFFHPSKKIREQWPNNEKRRLTGVLVTGEGMRHVNKKEQMCYLVRIPEIDDGTIFHIVKKNFKVDVAPPAAFESESRNNEARNASQVNNPQDANSAECTSQRNVVANVEGRFGADVDIEDLQRQGIAVDDDNEPAPENALPHVVAAQGDPPPPGTWEKPSVCPRHANSSIQDNFGKI